MSAEFFDRQFRDKVGNRERRLGSRSPPDPEKSRVKRALFGPVDHEENKRFFKREFDRDLDEKKRQYNFNFETEEPLEGRWDWNRVSGPPLPPPAPVAPLLALEVRASVSELRDGREEDPGSPKEEPVSAPEKPLEDARESSPEAPSTVCDKTSVSKGQASNSSSQNQRKSKMPDFFQQRKLPEAKHKTQDRKKAADKDRSPPAVTLARDASVVPEK